MGISWSCSEQNAILPRMGTGAYRVGCSDLMIKDSKDGDSGVFMRIYYPNEKEQPEPQAHPLWLPRKEYLEGLAGYLKQSSRRLQFFSNWIVGEKRSSAGWHLPLAGTNKSIPISTSMPTISSKTHKIPSSRSFSVTQPNFPVVVFSHGLAGCRHFYSTYCSSLASYGYVVAAIEHRDYSACWTYKLIPDVLSGRAKERAVHMKLLESGDKEFKIRSQQLSKRVSECVKTLHVLEELCMGTLDNQSIMEGNDFDWTQFKNRLSLSKTAIAGHSFGGATAMAATAFSTEFQASLVLDGWMFPLDADHYVRAGQPTLFLNAKKWQWKENLKNMRRFGNESERLMYSFSDAVHQTFSDFPYLVSNFVGKRVGLQGEVPADELMEAIIEMSVVFLRKFVYSADQTAVMFHFRIHEGELAGPTLHQLSTMKFANIMESGTGTDMDSET
ncbi:unnamed protein product [Auanema sp. JU1783]|nr:unnamed protein product [Auanema sp. JU1783]